MNQDDANAEQTSKKIRELNQKIAEQAAVIEKLWEALQDQCPDYCEDGLIAPGMACPSCTLHNQALAIPTDSKQILADWMRERLGEPVCYKYLYKFNGNSDSQGLPYDPCFVEKFSTYPPSGEDITPLYKLPELLR
jgi:hypothetical protein